MIWAAGFSTISDAKQITDKPNSDANALISVWLDLNGKCRGNRGDDPTTETYCNERESLGKVLEERGYCYTGNFGYEMRWEKCKASTNVQSDDPAQKSTPGKIDGHWAFLKKADLITDKIEYTSEYNWDDGRIVASCSYNQRLKTDDILLTFSLRDFNSAVGDEDIIYRIDKKEPVKSKGSVYKNSLAYLIGAPAKAAIHDFSTAASRIAVQLGSDFQFSFSVHPPLTALQKLLEHCDRPSIEGEKIDLTFTESKISDEVRRKFGLLIGLGSAGSLKCERVVSVQDVHSADWGDKSIKRVDCGRDGKFRLGKIPNKPSSSALSRWDLIDIE